MKYIRILKRVLKFAVEQSWLETNPVGRFKCTYIEPSRERLTMEEVMTLYHKEFVVERLAEVRDRGPRQKGQRIIFIFKEFQSENI